MRLNFHDDVIISAGNGAFYCLREGESRWF